MNSITAPSALSITLRKIAVICKGLSYEDCFKLVPVALGSYSEGGHTFLSALFDEAVAAITDGSQPAADSSAYLSMVCAAASLHFLQHQGTDIIGQFLNSFFLPLLSHASTLPSSASYLQVAVQLSSLLVRVDAAAAHELLKQCILSLQTICDEQKGGSNCQNQNHPLRTFQAPGSKFQLHTCCSLIPSLLSAHCSHKHSATSATSTLHIDGVSDHDKQALSTHLSTNDDKSSTNPQSTISGVSGAFMDHESSITTSTTRLVELTSTVQSLLSVALDMLLSQEGSVRKAALKAILPAVMTTGQVLGEDALDRKRALYLLQHMMLSPDELAGPAWSTWMMLYGLLEEFAVHLIKPAWSQISLLHPPAPEYAEVQEVLNVSAKRDKLRSTAGKRAKAKAKILAEQSKAAAAATTGSSNSIMDAGWRGVSPVISNTMPGENEGMSPATDTVHGKQLEMMDPEWLLVLWQRALQHPNLVVQRLALCSFLQRKWRNLVLVHQGKEALGHWLGAWLQRHTVSLEEQRSLVDAFVLLAGSKDCPRACLAAVWSAFSRALSAASCPAPVKDGWPDALLLKLQACRISISACYGRQYKYDLYCSLVQAAAALAPPWACQSGLAAPLELLASLPAAVLLAAGTAGQQQQQQQLLNVQGNNNAGDVSGLAGSRLACIAREWLLSYNSATGQSGHGSMSVIEHHQCAANDKKEEFNAAKEQAVYNGHAPIMEILHHQGPVPPAQPQGVHVHTLVDELYRQLWMSGAAITDEGSKSSAELHDHDKCGKILCRLLQLFSDIPDASQHITQQIEVALSQVYSRPYLPPGFQERTLTVFLSILQASLSSSVSSPLQAAVRDMVRSSAADLAACTMLCYQALWATAEEAAAAAAAALPCSSSSAQSSSTGTSSQKTEHDHTGGRRLDGLVQAAATKDKVCIAVLRASLSVQCCSQALAMLERCYQQAPAASNAAALKALNPQAVHYNKSLESTILSAASASAAEKLVDVLAGFLNHVSKHPLSASSIKIAGDGELKHGGPAAVEGSSNSSSEKPPLIARADIIVQGATSSPQLLSAEAGVSLRMKVLEMVKDSCNGISSYFRMIGSSTAGLTGGLAAAVLQEQEYNDHSGPPPEEIIRAVRRECEAARLLVEEERKAVNKEERKAVNNNFKLRGSSISAASLESAKWSCLDAILCLVAASPAYTSRFLKQSTASARMSGHQTTSSNMFYTSRQQQGHSSASPMYPITSGGDNQLLLPPSLCRALLAESLDVLQYCLEEEMVVVLRCLRWCWRQVIQGGHQEQAAMLKDLGIQSSSELNPADSMSVNQVLVRSVSAESTSNGNQNVDGNDMLGGGGGADDDGCSASSSHCCKNKDSSSTSRNALEVLCWEVVRPLCNAMCGCVRKKVPTIAAFVNTLAPPFLFMPALKSDRALGHVVGFMSASELNGLHGNRADMKTGGKPAGAAGAADAAAGVGSSSSSGPLYWAFSKLLDWGAASPRVTLLAATHLAALLDLNPDLLLQYSPLVKRILMYSSGGKGEGSDLLEVSAEACPEELEEVASLLHQQQQLQHYEAGGEQGGVVGQPRDTKTSNMKAGLWSADVHAGGGGGDVAPRAVIGMELYRLAVRAGCVREDAPTDVGFRSNDVGRRSIVSETQNELLRHPTTLLSASSKSLLEASRAAETDDVVVSILDCTAAAIASSATTAAAAAATAASSMKRPSIIFHEAGDWEMIPEASRSAAAAAATAATSSSITAMEGGHIIIGSEDRAAAAAAAAGQAGTVSHNLSSSNSNNYFQGSRCVKVEEACGKGDDPGHPLALKQGHKFVRSIISVDSTHSTSHQFVPTATTSATTSATSHDTTHAVHQGACYEAAMSLWQDLLSYAVTDPMMVTDSFKQGGEVHRRKTRLWQALAVLSAFVYRPADVRSAVQSIMTVMGGANSPPSVKQYLEGVVASLMLKQPELVEEVLLPIISTYTRNHAGVGSFMLIAGQVALHLPHGLWHQRLIPPLLLAMAPWLMCHTHNIRTFAQLLTYAILQKYPLGSSLWQHSTGDLKYISNIMKFMEENPDIVRLRKSIGDPILAWSPEGLTHPHRVYTTLTNLAGQPPEYAGFEGAPHTLMDRISAFLTGERLRLREDSSDWRHEAEYADGNAMTINHDKQPGRATAPTDSSAASIEKSRGAHPSNGRNKNVTQRGDQQTTDFQRKITTLDSEAAALGMTSSSRPVVTAGQQLNPILGSHEVVDGGASSLQAVAQSGGQRLDALGGCRGGIMDLDGWLHNLVASGLQELLDADVSTYEDTRSSQTTDDAEQADGRTSAIRPGSGDMASLTSKCGASASPLPQGLNLNHGIGGKRQGIIIVATLVDKLPNLAGLARTCEVFRASLLVLPDIRLAADPAFSAISVTAEQWVIMTEVQEGALLPWLLRKQAEGYCLLGLEQTAESIRLPDYPFPSQCVLVLGREKEGLPPEVLEVLDATVEIPQLGLIRSLNVHVSGAIALYEYTKQQLQHH
ncbi:hypothetical protein CEUSTIGMA_g8450.t1 [Chlamydomonas eustigma]|uniref:tRNA/rRNA methyltransferase SpoU type domain-containing protein n=1 Tax=Chlamydomonas eustigma TaxID=1157962 RepID=A0A250XD59_9CHLO|nr:hypothetical protein CEUSTIGMA_g8450.t1 [Chlamydomonas eustigma]|eukprot:GAX81015.1 hypothetical protein CEUSTIGMA_g8450.t1 [Chlamydomonas eustigma]